MQQAELGVSAETELVGARGGGEERGRGQTEGRFGSVGVEREAFECEDEDDQGRTW